MDTNWKSVNELPELHQEWAGPLRSNLVLVHRKSGKICVAYYEIWLDEDDEAQECETNWFTDDSEGWHITGEVTHWMPLPESPKEIQK